MFSSKITVVLSVFFNLLLMVNCWPNFLLYTRKNPSNFILVNDTLQSSSNFQANTETKIIIHGFAADPTSSSLVKMKDEILKKEDVNVIMIDWKEGAAAPFYFLAASNVKTAGARIALFIVKNKLNPKMIHCIGHSLGAHVCGFVGKETKLRRISGLDPAGPSFKSTNKDKRLDKEDADFVDNIHTDFKYGIQEAIGHKDFYPNGGALQPGCLTKRSAASDLEFDERNLSNLLACSHVRGPEYYVESIRSDCRFTSTLCKSYDNFKNNKCSCNTTACSPMGYNAQYTQDQGLYYLFVKSSSPFCKF